MRGRFFILLLLAVIAGLTPLIGARFLLPREEARGLEEKEAPAPVSLATIVVAAESLSFGTTLAPGKLRLVPWPEEYVPPGAFRKMEDLTKGEPRVVLSAFEAGEPILPGKITGPGERAGLARLIAPGARAVAVRVNDVAGVAGFILPGDRVDVVLTAQERESMRSAVILQGVKVLSVDQRADGGSGEPAVAKAVTLEVDPEGAQKIALAQTIGSLSLTLRRAGDVAPAKLASITPESLTAFAQAARPRSLAPAPLGAQNAQADATITVTRVLERQEYRVPRSEDMP